MVSNGAAVNATPKRLARFNAMKRVTLDQFKDSPSYVTRCQPKVEYGFERATCGPRTVLAAGERPNALYKCPPWSACGLTCFKQEAAAGDFVAPYLCMWWQGSTNELHAF